MSKKLWTQQECLIEVEKYIKKNGYKPKVYEWIDSGLTPHCQTIIRRFGTWKKMLQNFNEYQTKTKKVPSKYCKKNTEGKLNPNRKDAHTINQKGFEMTETKIYLNDASLIILEKINNRLKEQGTSPGVQSIIFDSLLDLYIKIKG